MEFDFESYKQKIAPALMDLEVVRKDAKKSIVGFVAFLIPMLAIGYYGMSQEIAKEQEIFYIAGVIITFGVAAYFAFRFSKLYRKLREEFKNLVVEKLLALLMTVNKVLVLIGSHLSRGQHSWPVDCFLSSQMNIMVKIT